MTNLSYKFYVGIDVSKAKLDVVMNTKTPVLQVTNDVEGLKSLVKQLPAPRKKTLIVLEASGGYEKNTAHYLREKGFAVAVVNAKRVRDFAKASGQLAKTDGIDAKIIMEFGKAFNPTAQPLSSTEGELRLQALKRRAQLIQMIAREKQHLEQTTELVKKGIKKHIAYLEKEQSSLEELLEAQFNQDPVLKEKVERLDEIKGVGKVTAMNLLTHLPELGTLSHKAVSALAGVAPYSKDSGQMKGKREISGGRAPVRAALYMAILSAIRSNAAIRDFYQQLIARGKLKKVALVACMRKLLITINAMMRNHTSWEPMR